MTNRLTLPFFTAVSAALCAAVLAVPAAANAAAGTPTAPQDLRGTAVGYDSVSLAWEPSSGQVLYYQILRNGLWVNSSYGTTGTVRYLSAGTTYTFEVRARDAWGNVSASAEVRITTRSDTEAPTTPQNLRLVTDAAGVPVGVSWDPSTDDRGIGGYWLLADGMFVSGSWLPGMDFFTLTDIECVLFAGETYTFSVVARDLSGKLSAPSAAQTVRLP